MTVKIIRFPAPVSRLGYYGHICSYHICFVVQYEFSIDDFAIRKQQFRCNYISSKIRLESIKHAQSLCWVTASPSSRQNQVPVIGKNSADKRLVFPDLHCCSYRVNQTVMNDFCYGKLTAGRD